MCIMKRIVYFAVALCLAFCPYDVLAEMKGVLVTDKDVSGGEMLRVEIRLEYDGKHEEIDVYQTVLEYDENLFSGVDESSFKTYSGWSDLQYNEDTHSLILVNRYGSSRSEDVVSFDLVLKDSVNPAETKIKLVNQIASNQNGDILLGDVENDVDVNVHLMNLGVLKTSKTTYGNQLIEQPVRLYHILTLIVLEVIIAAILVAIFKILNDRIHNEKLKKSFVGTLLVIELFALSAVFTYDISKGDLNGDKVLNGEDVSILAKHLVNSEMMSSFKLENADMNGDGRVTPTDLSILMGKASGRAHYEAKLMNSVMETNGYEKGTVIDLRFMAEVTNDEDIEYVVLDGERYKVDKVDGSENEYSIKLEAENRSDKYNYNITEVVLKNGKSAKVDYGTDVVVLKDIPVLSSFSTKEELRESSVKVALTLTDDDNAMTNAKYELVTLDGKVVANGSLDKGKNSLNLKLDNAVAYRLKFKIDYNRGVGSGEYAGTIEDEYDLKIITDYRLLMNNFSLVQNGVNTDKLEKSEQTYLTFTSSNVSGFAPRKLNVNGREYNVTSLGRGKYQVALPNFLFDGKELKITKTTLANGKVILVSGKVDYTVLSNKPTISDINMIEDVEKGEIKVNYILTDVDSTVEKLVVKLFDADNRLISEKEVTGGEATLQTSLTNKYTVRIYADYSRASDHHVTGELLGENSVDAIMQMQMVDYKAMNKYPDKNAILSLEYNITSNYRVSVSQIIVDNVIYDVSKKGIDTYVVDLDVGATAGVREYVTKKVIFENGVAFDVDEVTSVDVRKDYPTLDNYTVVENVKENRIDIAFDLFDMDGAFKNGQISLVDKSTGEVVNSKDVILGKNKASFILENAVKYDIRIDVSGVLDSEVLEEESPNKFENYNLYENEYRIVSDYKLEISDIITSTGEIQTDQFGANADINVAFSSSNVTEFVPQKIKVNGQYYDVEEKDGKYHFTIPGFTEPGKETLRFESLILSNHKELDVNAFKLIEILKAVPKVEELTLTKVSQEEVEVGVLIDDRDGAAFEKRAVILDIYGNEIYNQVIVDDRFRFDKMGNMIYTLRILASYDLNNGTDVMEENRYLNQVIYEGEIDETSRGFDMTKIEETILFGKNDNEIIDKVSSKHLDALDMLGVKITLDDGSETMYDILLYSVEGNEVTFVLNFEGWVTTVNNELTNFIKVKFDLQEETGE